jgi:hypothetical protein
MVTGTGEALPVSVKYLREVEPGLWWVSIDGDEPEYLMSAEWMQRQPGAKLALDQLNAKLLPKELTEAQNLRTRFTDLAAMWESRADHDVKFAETSVPEDLRDDFLDGAANFRLRAQDIRRILAEVPETIANP